MRSRLPWISAALDGKPQVLASKLQAHLRTGLPWISAALKSLTKQTQLHSCKLLYLRNCCGEPTKALVSHACPRGHTALGTLAPKAISSAASVSCWVTQTGCVHQVSAASGPAGGSREAHGGHLLGLHEPLVDVALRVHLPQLLLVRGSQLLAILGVSLWCPITAELTTSTSSSDWSVSKALSGSDVHQRICSCA